MSYFIIGSNYELADTSFSSKVAFSNEKMTQLHHELLAYGLADCALIISTCNRSEVLVYKKETNNLDEWTDAITKLVLAIHQLDTSYLDKFYLKAELDAISHLFRVACGLDSLVLGEPQITGQIKDAMAFTEQFYQVGKIRIPSEFYKLIDETFACAKEVRTKTSIGKYAVSIAYMACKIARNELPSSTQKNKILLVGASQTNLLLARHLVRNGLTNIVVINRSLENAKKFTESLGVGEYYGLESLTQALEDVSLVFSSTSSNNFILDYDLVENSQAKKGYQTTLFFDLAIPNDINPTITEIAGVKLYNRDNLQLMVEGNKNKRSLAVYDSLPIINKYLRRYLEQNRILQGNDIIVKYRESIHNHRQQLLNEAKHAISRGEDIDQVLENLTTSLTNKVLHTPTLILSSFIRHGQTCELSSIQDFIDRSDRESFGEIIEETLNKEVFKNTCCKGDQFKGSCIKNTTLIKQSHLKSILQSDTQTKKDISKYPFHSQATEDKDLKGLVVPMDFDNSVNQEFNMLVKFCNENNYDNAVGIVEFKNKK
ncbi:glutamyl-tRNA reductase [Psittacicella hinzii]|uniref:Glutamyl-tRNA reductase n=1 Tax=Psittacicella hinzii TaxID=2028575 RepID=A0A3A1Y649_9GAMM|nr:glutamyl-tRNA reductase [Psittacicella hinzii]RIY33732.1 glutamyl-tRNA reductase [Psittacicella hinzii]